MKEGIFWILTHWIHGHLNYDPVQAHMGEAYMTETEEREAEGA
jgi:hypothetical protein